jgi:GTP-binding protein EngB required for normal cell division
MERKKYLIDTSIIFQSISLLSQFGIEIKNLPKIIVLGEQNQGKSSLIDSLTQIQILPKSEGLCTKKPITLTLINSPETKYFVEDQQFDEVSASLEISKLNSNSNVSKINCIILSPNVQNCNITDTIGLIKISEEDQYLNPKKIKESVIDYLKDKNNIFVLVSSATLDLANSQMLQLIKKYDRTNDTIGVLTKIDLTENQNLNSIYDILSGKIYKLGYGWIPTKLRSDRDLNNGVTIEQSIINEIEYFKNRSFHNHATGIYEIRKAISFIQFERIKNNIPDIINEIDQKIMSLKSSQNFLQKIIDESDDQLASKLVAMIEKLVGSSHERSIFENCLKQKLKNFLLEYMNKIFGYEIDQYFEIDDNVSNALIDINIYNFHVQNGTVAKDLVVDDELHDMMNCGLISPISLTNETLKKAYEKECILSTLMPTFDFEVDDPLNKKKIAWVKYLEKYFISLQNGNVLQDQVYKITETMLLDYINNSNDDEISKRFTEYMIKDIGIKAFEEKMRYSLNALINIEQRPNVNMTDIVKQIITISKPNHLDYHQFYSIRRLFTRPNQNKLKIELYSEIWNIAYLRSVIDRLSLNCFRIVAVNLVNKMVENLLTMIISLNKDSSIRENEKINDKIQLLEKMKTDFSIFL